MILGLISRLFGIGARVGTLPVMIWFYVINDRLPGLIGRPISSAFHALVQSVFNLRGPLLLSDAGHWPGILKGPSLHKLPPNLRALLFMRGNPAPDGIGDPTHGCWDEETNTLTMELANPSVWSWNNNYDGSKLFFGAWWMGMKYIFRFNAAIDQATIESPVLGGIANFTDLVYGRGSRFEMKATQNGGWIRQSFRANGTRAFPDYSPTPIVTAKNGVDEEKLKLCLASVKDSPTFDSNAKMSGGATMAQVMRQRRFL